MIVDLTYCNIQEQNCHFFYPIRRFEKIYFDRRHSWFSLSANLYISLSLCVSISHPRNIPSRQFDNKSVCLSLSLYPLSFSLSSLCLFLSLSVSFPFINISLSHTHKPGMSMIFCLSPLSMIISQVESSSGTFIKRQMYWHAWLSTNENWVV